MNIGCWQWAGCSRVEGAGLTVEGRSQRCICDVAALFHGERAAEEARQTVRHLLRVEERRRRRRFGRLAPEPLRPVPQSRHHRTRALIGRRSGWRHGRWRHRCRLLLLLLADAGAPAARAERSWRRRLTVQTVDCCQKKKYLMEK